MLMPKASTSGILLSHYFDAILNRAMAKTWNCQMC
jgi:hypothetical protein